MSIDKKVRNKIFSTLAYNPKKVYNPYNKILTPAATATHWVAKIKVKF